MSSGPYSPYSINEADPPKWRPGEDIAAGAFVGMTLYLFVEVNVMIHRAFKRRQGLYFWSMQIGTLGILTSAVGIILKYFGSPRTDVIWPLYTLFIVVGWSVFATAQSLILYSRLHLVMRDERIQRYILYMIVSTIFTFVIPQLIFVWPSFNALDHEMSSLWSPREAIVSRYTQIGYTITESIISGLYIWSLFPLLRLKSNVRQRRVMTDLIYVNVVVIAFDILQVTLEYTNQVGFSQPLQCFSYILKMRLEFVVLNQLMDVAARGMRHQTFGRNRYYHTDNKEGRPSHDNAPSQEAKSSHLPIKRDSPIQHAQTALASTQPLSDPISPPKPIYQSQPTNRSASDVQGSGLEYQIEPNLFDQNGFTDRQSLISDGNPFTPKASIGAGFYEKPSKVVKGFFHQSVGPPKDSKLLAFRRGDRSHDRSNSGDKVEDEGEIELQLWERRGTAVVDIPWFLSKVGEV
ncbi:hypothetical protein MMC29_006655 [Sticta canariensis]|nr:hypothetical protein [Sticta canariensis]